MQKYSKTMNDDREAQYGFQPQIQYVEDDPSQKGAFYYTMEQSLADNMYNLSVEADNNYDDVDLSPSPSSRPPPEPFGIKEFSEDDPIEIENMTTLASISIMIKKESKEQPDVKELMKSVEPELFKYGTIMAEFEKWTCLGQDYLDENDFSSIDGDSYTP